jgi:hypothetical protein
MDDLRFNDETPTHPGGIDVTFCLTPEEATAIGPDANQFFDQLHSAVSALVMLRNQTLTPNHAYTLINDLGTRLIPRLEAIRDETVRAHSVMGGSVGQLARAMDVPRSTAQGRRDAILANPTSFCLYGEWATTRA